MKLEAKVVAQMDHRIMLQGFVCRSRKISQHLQALNILDLDEICDKYINKDHFEIYNEHLRMKSHVRVLKTTIDNYDLADHFNSCLPISNYFLNHLSVHLSLHFKKYMLPIHSKHQYHQKLERKFHTQSLYEIEVIKKLLRYVKLYTDSLLNVNLFNCYVTRVMRDCKNFKWRISFDTPSTMETHLEKFIKVCEIMPPTFKITLSTPNGWKHYKLIANLLKICYKYNLSNSKILTELLKIVLKMHIANFESTIVLPFNSFHTSYPDGFYLYVLDHAKVNDFHLASYISNHADTIWQYSEKFSVIDAVVSGDIERVKNLLKHGFEVFPEHEEKRSGHKYAHILQVIPPIQRMILEIMKKIKSNYGGFVMTKEQKKCFNFIWRDIPEHFVTRQELLDSIQNEKEHLRRNSIKRLEYMDRYRRNKRLAHMYSHNFNLIAESTKPECIFRSLIYAQYKSEKHSNVSGVFISLKKSN